MNFIPVPKTHFNQVRWFTQVVLFFCTLALCCLKLLFVVAWLIWWNVPPFPLISPGRLFIISSTPRLFEGCCDPGRLGLIFISLFIYPLVESMLSWFEDLIYMFLISDSTLKPAENCCTETIHSFSLLAVWRRITELKKKALFLFIESRRFDRKNESMIKSKCAKVRPESIFWF